MPGAPPEVFETIIKASDSYQKEQNTIESLWKRVKTCMYSLTEKEKTLGFPDNVSFTDLKFLYIK